MLSRGPAHSPGDVFARLHAAAAEIGELRRLDRQSMTLEVALSTMGGTATLQAEVATTDEGDTSIGFTLQSPAEATAPPIRAVVEDLLERIRKPR